MSKKKTTATYIVGIDEVGRGPIAGPVTVCVFAIPVKNKKLLESIPVRDSKKLSARTREIIARQLHGLAKEGKCFFFIVSVSAAMIDSKGIISAVHKALHKGLKKLEQEKNIQPNEMDIFLDGSLYASDRYPNQQTIIKGDDKIPVISCASILAKVHRDCYMSRMAKKFYQYGFDSHKGYGTRNHYEMIRRHGMISLHRKTFLASFDK